MQSRLCEHVLVRGIAEDHRVAGLPRRADTRRIQIERDKFKTLRFEHPRNILPDAPEAAQDHVIARGDLPRRRRLALDRRRRRPLLAQQQTGDALVVAEDERAEHHGEHDRHQQRFAPLRRNQTAAQRDREERDAKLAADRHHDPRANGLERRANEGARHECSERALDHDEPEQHEGDRGELIDEQPHIQEHADGNEKQTEQNVAKRPDDDLDLMAIFGFGNHHPGEKRTERERQAGKIGSPRRREHDEEHREREQLAQTRVGDHVEKRPQEPAARRQHDHDRECTAGEEEQRPPDREVGGAAACKSRGEREQRHECQVLKEEHAESEPPVGAVELRAVGELVEDDRRRAHGDGAADHRGDEPWHAQKPCDDGHDRDRKRHLCSAEAKHLAAHGEHARKGKFQPQREEQKDDAELGEETRRLRLRDDADRVRAEAHPDDEIAQDGRQAEPPRNRDDQQRCREQNEDLGQRLIEHPQT